MWERANSKSGLTFFLGLKIFSGSKIFFTSSNNSTISFLCTIYTEIVWKFQGWSAETELGLSFYV